MITRRSVTMSLSAALAALAVRTPRTQSQPAPTDPTKFPVVFSVPGMANARVHEGLVYKTVEGSPLHFDVYSPAGFARVPSPAVILVHGSIPKVGVRGWGVFTSYGRMLAAMGMTGIVFDHRLLGPDRLRDSATDVADLVQHVRQNAAMLGFDPNRMALWSYSRGGSLISAALRERQSWWKLLVAYYPLLEPLDPGHDERLSAIAALGRDASNAPPVVLARAGRDDPALNTTVDRFLTAANSAGATVDLLTHPAGPHGFDVIDPSERSKEIIRRTLEALQDRLGVHAQAAASR